MRNLWKQILLRAAGLLCIFAFPALGQKSTLNLESLISQSGMIFSGTVIAVETGTKDRQMNLFMTYYTFRINDGIYGVDSDTVRIKQYGGEANGKKFYPKGIPRFEKGEEVLVMLYPPSKIGMTSTVGREQGKFIVQPADSEGVSLVTNGVGNKGLFKKLRHPEMVAEQEWTKHQSGPVPYRVLIETIRNLVPELKKNGGKL